MFRNNFIFCLFFIIFVVLYTTTLYFGDKGCILCRELCWLLFDSFDCSFKRVHIMQRSESKRICTTAYRDDKCL
ncbi:hypothetical protein T01_13518 [Trichinella spiralis]|uniref:Uncharacterized protein n=1 Tax=Trichinella spiralis TaxID=6334 RepID=A0A0V0Z1V4_TRISP|nr:hypothetical protein T01_13518 [Trichinella spiralis]